MLLVSRGEVSRYDHIGHIDSLKTIKLTAMVAELEHQLEASSTYSTLGFEELWACWLMQNGIVVR